MVEELVLVDAAKSSYGVVLNNELSLDEAATKTLREKLKGSGKAQPGAH